MYRTGYRPSGWRIGVFFSCLLVCLSPLFSTAQAALPFDNRNLVGRDGNPSLAPLMREVTPAVVNIATRSRVAVPVNPLFNDPFFRRFFNLPERPQPREQLSAGSGVIVDADRGYVLTNNHVIEDADDIVVRLKDRREYQAELIGRDPGTDIAVLKIKAKGLTALPFGNSDQLQVGDFVVAIGNPFGLGQTVTSGIVSALGRSGLNIEGYEDFIQTDASINPGNSGGALVNLRGELVGINTAIIGPAGGNVGIGFAVPSNMARVVLDQLIEYGEVKRGQLGVIIQDISAELAQALGLETTNGAVVTEVAPGSAAQTAGIQPGDVIVAVDGRPVRNSGDLRNRIGLLRIGSNTRITLIREGRELTVDARIGIASASADVEGEELRAQLAGARFADNPRGSGVRVTDVQRGSPAARYGLRPDDLIYAVNRREVSNLADFRREVSESGRVLALSIQRGNMSLFIVIQ